MSTVARVSLNALLGLALGAWPLGCQEYAGLADIGVLPGEEPRDEEPRDEEPRDEEPQAEEPFHGCDGGDCSCDGGDCGVDEGPDWGPDGGDGECVSPSPQPMRLSLSWEPHTGECPFDNCALSHVGPAEVVFRRHLEGEFSEEAWLLWEGIRIPIRVKASLPDGRTLPVSLGDRFRAFVLLYAPRWDDHAVRLSTHDGLLVYEHLDHFFDSPAPQGRCPPRMDLMGCGRQVFPILEGGIEQGLDRVYERDGALRHLWIGELWQYLEMDCEDVPMGWIQSADVSHALRSACRCEGPADCARDEICEPYAHGCVRNPCVVMDCAPGYVCDPFRGECVDQPAWGCSTDADCGPDEICHPVTQACIQDFCRNIDCAPCSPLLGGCYGCLHDCECGIGVCDRELLSCVEGCDLDRLVEDLRPENPAAYELVYVCLEDRLDDPTALLVQFEPAAVCGVQPPPGTCPAGAPVVCLVPLERYPNQTGITWEAWQRLCHLSRNPLVRRLVGGVYLP